VFFCVAACGRGVRRACDDDASHTGAFCFFPYYSDSDDNIRRLQARLEEGEPTLNMSLERLDPVVELLQLALSSGHLTREHIMYQHLFRMLTKAYGIPLKGKLKNVSLDKLRRQSETLLTMYGSSVLSLLRGPAASEEGTGAKECTPKQFFDTTFSGHFHPRHVQRTLARYAACAQ
jgi:hypothetical protein